jgi:hypothetical protein
LTQETSAGEAAPPITPDTPAPSARRRRPSLPGWLPLAALAIVPALIVGGLVYALKDGGDSGGNNEAATIIEAFLRPGAAAGDVESFNGRMPDDFPSEFPLFRGARPVSSFVFETDEGVSYFAILSTSASQDEVLRFYLERLDDDPWQVEIARSSDEFTGVRFTRPDDPDVQGDVTIHGSNADGRTAIFVSFQDVTPSGRSNPTSKPFELGASRPLPANFPNDVPIYKSNDSTVTETYFERAPGGTAYIVSFLTKDDQDDVIGFYRSEFEKKGWTVTDSANQPTGFTLSIDFNDGTRQSLQGSVQADSFEDDSSYTKVDLLLQVTGARNRGN